MDPVRRRRVTTLVTTVGLMLLFACVFALPEALVRLGRAASETAAQPLTAGGVAVVIAGFGTLVVGGVLSIAGMVLRRTAVPQHNPEDDYTAEQFDEEHPVRDYDPTWSNPHLRSREH